MSTSTSVKEEFLEPSSVREWDRDRERDRGSDGGFKVSSVWKDVNERSKRRRSPSASYPSQRPRQHSPESYKQRSRQQQPMELTDPALIPSQLTFKQFADWFWVAHPSTAKLDDEEFRRYKADVEDGVLAPGEAKERIGMGKRYERYRKEYTSRQLFTLYLTHRDSPWFTERYSPSAQDVDERKRIIIHGRTRTITKYIAELQAGVHDDVSFDQTKAESAISEPNRYAQPEDSDRYRQNNGEAKIEIQPVPNQIFVRSVPPTMYRKDVENLFRQCHGFEYLALSEPSIKRAFHRVAWAQYADGVDVQEVVQRLNDAKIDNFTFHLGVNESPTIGWARFTPALAGTLARLIKDGSNAEALALKLEAESADGSAVVDSTATVAEGSEVKMEGDGEAEQPTSLPSSSTLGSTVVKQVIERVLETADLARDDLSEEQTINKAKITLDHWISYLRHGLSTCYYCVAACPYPEELLRKCVGHMRTVTDHSKVSDARDGGDVDMTAEEFSNTKVEPRGPPGRYHSDEKWEEGLDGKLALMLGSVNVVDYEGRDIEEEIKTLTAPLIKQETTSKFRCKECSKLFKAEEFVAKHVIVKHGVTIQPKLNDLATFNNFVLDPQHLPVSQQVLGAVEDRLPVEPSGPSIVPNFSSNLAISAAAAAAAVASSSGTLNTPQQQQQMMAMMQQMQQAMMAQMDGGGGGRGRDMAGGRGGGNSRRGNGENREPLPFVQEGKEDPRAKKGRVSYKDLDVDGGADGDGGSGLPY